MQHVEDFAIMDSRRKNRNFIQKHREKGYCPSLEASGNSKQHGINAFLFYYWNEAVLLSVRMQNTRGL